jgi:hypothetical protein
MTQRENARMSEADGVIKYRLDYRPGPLPPVEGIDDLFLWFARCRELGLIGQDPARYGGFAFGNISCRAATGFVVSGTQTGGNRRLAAEDLAWVETFDLADNRLIAGGPCRPSSEAMTHGQIYQALRAVNAVIHVHSPLIWDHAQALGLALTARSAAYGTPEMAAEVARLLRSCPTRDMGLFVMGGHEDGVVAYGARMDTAGALLLDALARARQLPARPAPA